MKREIKQEISFNEKGMFESYYKACGWLDKNNYSYGSMCGSGVNIGILKGDHCISKWRNLTNFQITQLDGIMYSDNYREGEVIIVLYK